MKHNHYIGFALSLILACAVQAAAEDAELKLVKAAAIYGYAPDGMLQRLSAEVLDPATRKAGFNEFYHYTALATPEVTPFRAPNNDTLYSLAWLDLRHEPVILQTPDTKGRYFTAHAMDLYTETIANIGARLHGTEAATFAFVGPGWKGRLPDGIKAVVHSETTFVLILLRNLVDGPEDVPAVVALQQQFKLASLSRHEKGLTGAAPDAAAGLPLYHATNATQRLEVLDRILRMNPVRPGEEKLMQRFAALGIGPELKQAAIKPTAATLEQAVAEAQKEIKDEGMRGGLINGWRVVREGIGTYGTDYLGRASIWDGGPLANVPEESLYPSAVLDSTGKMLDGTNTRYVIRFAKEQIPPVSFFWSLTMYQMRDGMLVKNPLQRYAIGNRTRGLKFEDDGSLVLYIQSDSPGAEKESNWLPAPAAGFYMAMRLYGPKKEAVLGEWVPPAIQPVK